MHLNHSTSEAFCTPNTENNSSQSDAIIQAIGDIFDAHPTAHFIPLKPDTKEPAWKGYKTSRPAGRKRIMKLAADGYGLGLVPISVGCSVIDFDDGNHQIVTDENPPLFFIKTTRGGHAYYSAGDNPPVNSTKSIVVKLPGGEAKIDVISGAHDDIKYCRIPATEFVNLANHLARIKDAEAKPFPHEVPHQIPLRLSADEKRKHHNPLRFYRVWREFHPHSINLDNAKPSPKKGKGKRKRGDGTGTRNKHLFGVLSGKREFCDHLKDIGEIKSQADLLYVAVLLNLEMPTPYSYRETAKLEGMVKRAWKCLTEDAATADGKRKSRKHYDHSPQAQSRHRKVGIAKHNADIAPDQMEAHRMFARGHSKNLIAKLLGVDERTVRRWLKVPFDEILRRPSRGGIDAARKAERIEKSGWKPPQPPLPKTATEKRESRVKYRVTSASTDAN